MSVLKVLDLTDNQIKVIPKSLAGCVKVKGNLGNKLENCFRRKNNLKSSFRTYVGE